MSSNVEYEICLYFSFNCSVERFKSFSHQQRELETFVTKIAAIVTKGLKGQRSTLSKKQMKWEIIDTATSWTCSLIQTSHYFLTCWMNKCFLELISFPKASPVPVRSHWQLPAACCLITGATKRLFVIFILFGSSHIACKTGHRNQRNSSNPCPGVAPALGGIRGQDSYQEIAHWGFGLPFTPALWHSVLLL